MLLSDLCINAMLKYFEIETDEFSEVLEDLDGWNGYLSDDRCYFMEELDEFFSNCKPTEILDRAYYGRDEYGDEFCPNRTYFYFNGYGNLVSTDDKDYSDHLYKSCMETIIEYSNELDYSLPETIKNIIKLYNRLMEE